MAAAGRCHGAVAAVARICGDGIALGLGLGLVERTDLARVVGGHATAYGAPSPQAVADLLSRLAGRSESALSGFTFLRGDAEEHASGVR